MLLGSCQPTSEGRIRALIAPLAFGIGPGSLALSRIPKKPGRSPAILDSPGGNLARSARRSSRNFTCRPTSEGGDMPSHRAPALLVKRRSPCVGTTITSGSRLGRWSS
jgi:hypothetical protein